MSRRLRQFWLAGGLFCLTSSCTNAQSLDMAVTDDGSQLFFSSALRFIGPSESASDQIFQYANGGYTLIGKVPRRVTLSDGSVFPFGLQEPNVSGDGAVLAYDGTATCFGGPSCAGAFTTRGYIVGEQLPQVMTFYGSLRVSHNGRFSLRFGGTAAGIPPGPADLYDSQAQQLSLVNSSIIGDGRQSIADDGTVLTTQGLWQAGSLVPLPTPQSVTAARISPNGATVVFESAQISCSEVPVFPGSQESCTLVSESLVSYSVGTGVTTPIATWDLNEKEPPTLASYFLPTVSTDGTLALYRAPDPQSKVPQVFLSATNGGFVRELTNDPAGIAEAALAGGGDYAFAATGDGRLLEIFIDTGQVQTLLPGAPVRRTPPGR
jgi:hypothetical protein